MTRDEQIAAAQATRISGLMALEGLKAEVEGGIEVQDDEVKGTPLVDAKASKLFSEGSGIEATYLLFVAARKAREGDVPGTWQALNMLQSIVRRAEAFYGMDAEAELTEAIERRANANTPWGQPVTVDSFS